MYRSSAAPFSLIKWKFGAVRSVPAVPDRGCYPTTRETGSCRPRPLQARVKTEVHGSACYRKATGPLTGGFSVIAYDCFDGRRQLQKSGINRIDMRCRLVQPKCHRPKTGG